MILRSKFPIIFVFELKNEIIDNKLYYIKQNGQHHKNDGNIILFLEEERKYHLLHPFLKVVNQKVYKAIKILKNGEVWWVNKNDVAKV
jgi:hypothetical protein